MDGGFDLCRELRQRSPHMPIIFLTARDSDIDRVSGLRLDAWDYITKPVNLQFLAVRVSSLFRIASMLATDSEQPQVLIVEDLALDQNTMSVSWKGTNFEFNANRILVDRSVGETSGTCQNL